MFVKIFRPYILFNLILFFSFSISVNTIAGFEDLNLLFYIFFHLTFIYTLFYYYNYSIFILALFYGILFDIFLLNEISIHLIIFILLTLLYILIKKYLFLLSAFQASITIYITLITILFFELILSYFTASISLNFVQMIKYILLSTLIFIPSIYLFNKVDK